MNTQSEASACSWLTWCWLWEISNMGGGDHGSLAVRCARSRAGTNCLVGSARRCPAGETGCLDCLDCLMAQQVADAHENATRQAVCPLEGRGPWQNGE